MMNPSFISLFVIEETDALFKEVILLNSALDISMFYNLIKYLSFILFSNSVFAGNHFSP